MPILWCLSSSRDNLLIESPLTVFFIKDMKLAVYAVEASGMLKIYQYVPAFDNEF